MKFLPLLFLFACHATNSSITNYHDVTITCDSLEYLIDVQWDKDRTRVITKNGTQSDTTYIAKKGVVVNKKNNK